MNDLDDGIFGIRAHGGKQHHRGEHADDAEHGEHNV